VNELDNRGSHFYLSLYWAEALAAQTKDEELKLEFTKIASSLLKNEKTIVNELITVQGQGVDTDGYYLPNSGKTDIAMRPSTTLNRILGL
jgi:isocitrate dehydrogenase